MCRQIETLWHQTSLFFSLRVGIGIPRADCLIVCPICFLPFCFLFWFWFSPFVGLVSIVFLDDLPLLTFVSFLSIRPQINILPLLYSGPATSKFTLGLKSASGDGSCQTITCHVLSACRHLPLQVGISLLSFHSLLVRPSSAMMATGPPHIGLRNFVWFQFILFPLLAVYFWKKRMSTHRCHRQTVVDVVVGWPDELPADGDERRRAGLESRSGCDKWRRPRRPVCSRRSCSGTGPGGRTTGRTSRRARASLAWGIPIPVSLLHCTTSIIQRQSF